MSAMYSNARFAIKRRPTTPRSASETTNAGTVAMSMQTSYKPPRLPKYRTSAKDREDTSMRSRTAYDTPEIHQMNANTVSFATIRSTPTAQTKPAGLPHVTQRTDTPTTTEAGTRVELAKHRPIAQHIGATYQQYPHTKIGDTLLRQQAVLAINSSPGLIDRLHQDIADIKKVRHASTVSPPLDSPEDWHNAEDEPAPQPSIPEFPRSNIISPPTRQGSQGSQGSQGIDAGTAQRIRDLEHDKAKMVGALLHFDPAKNVKISAGALQTLKKARLIDASVETLTQRQAHAVITTEITRIDEVLAELVRGR